MENTSMLRLMHKRNDDCESSWLYSRHKVMFNYCWFHYFFLIICLTGLMWRLNELIADGLECHLYVGCYKKKKENIRRKEFKEWGPTPESPPGSRSGHFPDLCDRFKLLAVSSKRERRQTHAFTFSLIRELKGNQWNEWQIIDCTTH